MRTFALVSAALWMVVNATLIISAFYLSTRMLNHRVPKQEPTWTWGGGRRFAFQTDPADYTEIGRAYRNKAVKVETALLAWMFIFPIAIGIITGGK